jgi:WD40 repeat protein
VPTGKLITEIPGDQLSSAITFSPDSKSFSVATPAGPLICDTATGKKISQFSADVGRALAFSADGKRITDGERVWDTGTGQELSRLQQGEIGVRAVEFSPDGKYIATGTSEQLALLWDPATGQLVKTLKQRRQRSYGGELEDLLRHDYNMTVSFNEDGKYLATAGGDVQARVWEIESQHEIAMLSHQDMVFGAVFTHDGERVLTTGQDVRLWEAFSNHELTRITEGGGRLPYMWEAKPSRSGKYVVVAGGQSVSVWESATGMVSRRFLHKTAATDVTFSRDGKLLATCDTTTAQVWDVVSSELIAPPLVQQEPNIGASWRDQVKSVAFSADGKLLATANGDQTARIWDVSTGSEIARFSLKGTAYTASFSPDGKFFVTASSGDKADVNINLWNGPDWHLAFQEKGWGTLFIPALLSPDGKLLGIADENKLRILEVANRKQICSIDTEGSLSAFVFSPDSKYVATADDKGAVGIFEIASGRRVGTLKHEAAVGSVIFSPDGKYVASRSGATARIWDWIKGTEVSRFPHEADVADVAFSPDGKILATAAAEDAHVWDAASGAELARISHDQVITRVVFSPPDGKALATAGDDGVVQLSLWRPQDLLDEACARLTRNLTPEEWHRYLGDQPYRKTCPALPSEGVGYASEPKKDRKDRE